MNLNLMIYYVKWMIIIYYIVNKENGLVSKYEYIKLD